MKSLWIAIVGIIATGCTADRTNFDSLYIASTFDSLITKQVAFNLLKASNDEFGIPSYVKIGTQTAQNVSSITPMFTAPLTAQSSVTRANTISKTLQTAGGGMSLQMQASAQTSYTINAVDDPDQLRRLRAIFQYASGFSNEFNFETDYPIIAAADKDEAKKDKDSKITYVRRACEPQNIDGEICKKYTWKEIKPDLTFIRPPGCIMCDYNTPLSLIEPGQPKNKIILQKNILLAGRRCVQLPNGAQCQTDTSSLLFYPPGMPIDGDVIAVPAIGGENLNVKGRDGLKAFYELVLFAQEAASQGVGSPASGGQSYGRKTEPTLRVSGPAAGGFVPLQ